MDPQATEMESASSPTRSAQEVLRRMSLNSPPSRADNPRQVKRPKLLASAGGATAAGASGSQAAAQASTEALSSSQAFAAPQNRPSVNGSYRNGSSGNGSFAGMATPARKTAAPRRSMLAAPSPMPTWGSQGMNLRDASAGEVLEASDPSSFYPSFQLDCLRQPEEGPSSNSGSPSSPPSPAPSATSTATAMDDEDTATAFSSAPGDDHFAPPPSPARLKMRAAAAGARGGARERAGVALALDEAKSSAPGEGQGAAVPETPIRRPGSGVRSRLDRVNGGGGSGVGSGGEHSCSPVRGYGSGFGSDAQGSPVKKRGVGRWRLSVGGGGGDTDGDGFPGSPLLGNRNPFSPAVGGGSRGARLGRGGNGDEDDTPNTNMPAPPPRRSRASPGGRVGGVEGSPMDTVDAPGSGLVDFGTIVAGSASGKGDEGSFLRRVSTGSCVSLADACGEGGGKSSKDVSKPSPCDVTAFAPVTPFRDGFPGMSGADSGGRDDAPMSPVPDADGGMYVPAGKTGGIGVSGRFATDFEELEVIGSGSFGTVYKVRSRVDGCLYAVKCTRRRFKGRADRQNMLREVYALAAVCDAQDTINIVRYHQAWIEDERLYIQTELCETSLEKQLESGERLEISGVYAFLRQTLLGLDILHQHNLVHLDIKPGNIFVKNGQYKLGDFGLVTTVHVGSGADVVEGDSRYMSKELLSDDHSNLTKCDVFSLGITLYEIISGRPLPPNGEEWHRLRSGKVGMPMGLPAELSKTLNAMMHSEMERQLNEQVSQLHKERSHNDDLLKEVSALIQKQSQRSGRLSRTITWDNSYFTKSDPGPLFSQYESSAAAAAGAPAVPPGGSGGRRPNNPSRPVGEMPTFTGRGRGLDRGQGGLFNPCPLRSGAFGDGDSAPSRFGAGFPANSRGGGTGNAAGAGSGVGGGGGMGLGGGVGGGLASLSEGGEEGVVGGPVTFERLRQSPTAE